MKRTLSTIRYEHSDKCHVLEVLLRKYVCANNWKEIKDDIFSDVEYRESVKYYKIIG